MNKQKLPIILASAALVLSIFAVVLIYSPSTSLGSVGEKLIENYLPYVKYNEGIYSALGITTTDAMTAGDLAATDDLTVADDSTLTGDLTVSGATDVSTFTQGGGRTATSTVNSAETLLASYFDTENIIEYTPNLSAVTVTVPASSTLSSVAPNTGDVRQVWLKNATSTSNMHVTLVAGAGETLIRGTSTPSALIAPGKYAVLTFIRKATTDFDILLNIFDN